MKIYLLTLLCLIACSVANAEDKNTDKKERVNTYKKDGAATARGWDFLTTPEVICAPSFE